MTLNYKIRSRDCLVLWSFFTWRPVWSGRSRLISTDLIHSSKTNFALELNIQFANTGASLSVASVHERRRVSDLSEENKFLMCAKLQKRGFCEKPSERKETLRFNNPRLLHTWRPHSERTHRKRRFVTSWTGFSCFWKLKAVFFFFSLHAKHPQDKTASAECEARAVQKFVRCIRVAWGAASLTSLVVF